MSYHRTYNPTALALALGSFINQIDAWDHVDLENGRELEEAYQELGRAQEEAYAEAAEAQRMRMDEWRRRRQEVTKLGYESAADLGIFDKHGANLGYTVDAADFPPHMRWALMDESGGLKVAPEGSENYYWSSTFESAIEVCANANFNQLFALYIIIPYAR